VWLARPEEVTDARLLRSYEALLSADERGRLARFALPAHRHEYLVAHALLRAVLGRRRGVPGHALRFAVSRLGRPELADGATLRFSLSHTSGLVACAVSAGYEVGVDVEDCRRRLDTLGIAARLFSTGEAGPLRGLSGRERDERFFTLWTLKEAYLKARGLGLSVPPEWARFAVAADHRLEATFAPRLNDRPGDWQFAALAPTADHRGAVAVRRGMHPDVRIRVRQTVPLRDETVLACRVLAATPPRLH
jgi:4'-phosphopantetheinyl transferase